MLGGYIIDTQKLPIVLSTSGSAVSASIGLSPQNTIMGTRDTYWQMMVAGASCYVMFNSASQQSTAFSGSGGISGSLLSGSGVLTAGSTPVYTTGYVDAPKFIPVGTTVVAQLYGPATNSVTGTVSLLPMRRAW